MQVIIVEVTRAASTFGRTHIGKISEAYASIADIVRAAQEAGELRSDVSAEFVAMTFYGAIEQVLTGWIFDLLPTADGGLEAAKELIVETICGGLRLNPRV